MYILSNRLSVHAGKTLQRLVNQSFFRCALFQFLPVESTSPIDSDHSIESLACFSNGDHSIVRAQPAQQKSFFCSQHFFLLMVW